MPRFNNMLGKKIGMLTVKELSHRSVNGTVNWGCLCDCGNVTTMTAGSLQKAEKEKRNPSCGCSKIKDLTGQKFTKLTVTKFSHTDAKGTWWECLCDCGNIKLAKSNSLKIGDTKSCGCLKSTDITDQKFGRLTAIRRIGTKNNNPRWECFCECGVVKDYALNQIVSGKTKSCGCLQRDLTIERNTKHGHSTREDMTDTYVIWCGIKGRCFNANEPAYKNYGARGITMCERWKDSFENFLEDMGERPSKNHSIDRVDNEKGYEPTNCRWATRAEQSRNNRRNVWVEFNGQKKTISDWADQYGLDRNTVRYRIYKAGWDVGKALTTPTKSV